MGDVYARAERVVIWLGEDDGQIDFGLGLMLMISILLKPDGVTPDLSSSGLGLVRLPEEFSPFSVVRGFGWLGSCENI